MVAPVKLKPLVDAVLGKSSLSCRTSQSSVPHTGRREILETVRALRDMRKQGIAHAHPTHQALGLLPEGPDLPPHFITGRWPSAQR